MSKEKPPIALRVYAVLFTFVMLAPIVVVVASSFGENSYLEFPPTGFTIHWYEQVFKNDSFINAARVSTFLAAGSVLLTVVLGVPAALYLARPGRHRRSVESFLLSPLSFPTIVLGVSLLFVYGLLGFGLSPIGLLAGHVAVTLPYMIRSVLAVKRGVNPHLEEAAATLGGGPVNRFRFVTLPLIRPGLMAGAVFAFLVSFDNVPISLFLTRHDTTTLPISILSYLQYNSDPSVAAVSAIQAVLVFAILVFLERRLGLKMFERMETTR